MQKKHFIIVKIFKGKGPKKCFDQFWLLKEFFEVVPSSTTLGWVCPNLKSQIEGKLKRNKLEITKTYKCKNEKEEYNTSIEHRQLHEES
jgi:hypothetical protein